MNTITINAIWKHTDYGYIVGLITVTNGNGECLMRDEDMYYNPDKFFGRVKRMFDIPRFRLISKTYYKSEQRLEIVAEDLKSRIHI